ncbi:5-formyltetrahydrofolate cyclo-ligase [Oceanobacillus massiliensis]|uniref:5-formyltetrahydrofolate cyclo-ligase n=1 Tax=Oceanobacillus massiliensis TaxID=1465765 RepID=UPI003017F1E6
MEMDKKELRIASIKRLKNLSSAKKQRTEEILTTQLLSSSAWQNAEKIGITIAQGFEWATKPIIEAGWEQQKSICVPKCFPDQKKLVFYELESFNHLVVAHYSLLEPNPELCKAVNKDSMDLMIVPGILFDRNGFRIGFGGGYYDRFLKDYSGKSISLCSKEQLVDNIPRQPFDLPVSTVVTEDEIFEAFNRYN